ncbi:MAG TPA: hypothetical protein VJP80_02560 [Candidatus Saccharimonadales bacterium]|nr:hypothetical protein [Candidatus Saccharimonadales bacterium]
MTTLTETPDLNNVSDEYFYRMLSPSALKTSAPYHLEEKRNITKALQACPNIAEMNFVAVGGGELWELRSALRYAKRYVCIEPLAHIFFNDSIKYMIEERRDIDYIAKGFEAVSRDELPKGGCFFMFLFNILAYIKEPISAINNIVRPGDVLFITTWADTREARRTRQAYLDHLNRFEEKVVIDPAKTIGLSHLEHFPFNKLHSYKRHEYIQGTITETLVIYT